MIKKTGALVFRKNKNKFPKNDACLSIKKCQLLLRNHWFLSIWINVWSLQNESKLFEPSTSISPSNVAETIPKIVISTPTSAKYFNPRGVETSRSEVFATARTSRVEDTQQYASMSDLVRSIREEAGFGDDTPRPTTTATQVGITVSELRIGKLWGVHVIVYQ